MWASHDGALYKSMYTFTFLVLLYTPVQACRHGKSRDLEHLMFYGADINAVNNTGNTALHTSALNGQVTRTTL